MKKCLLTIPKHDLYGSIIFLALTLLYFLAQATLSNNAPDLILFVSVNISTFTLTALSIATIQTGYYNQHTIKRNFQLFTTILFSIISIFLLMVWVQFFLGGGGGQTLNIIFIIGTLSMALTGAITLIWTFTHLATCLLRRR